MRSQPVVIAGTGAFLPTTVLGNAEAASLAGVEPGWIERRTGILERRVAGPAEGTASLGFGAGAAALADAGIEAGDLGLIVVATSTPDHLTPPTACEIQARLGATGAAAFDVEAGFAGWVYALIVADALVRGGAAETALVIGAEKLSTVTDRSDPATGPLFGDGAGAVVLAAEGDGLCITASTWWADGTLADALVRPGGGALRPFDASVLAERSHLLRMEGTRLFRQAVRTMADQTRRVLDSADVALDDVELIVPHQANRRIIDAFSRELGVDPDRVFINIDTVGNTGAATVPVALDAARRAGRVRTGPVLLVSFGAGATAGAVLLGLTPSPGSAIPRR